MLLATAVFIAIVIVLTTDPPQDKDMVGLLVQSAFVAGAV